MKTKKYGLIAALTAALVITALIIGCMAPIDGPGDDQIASPGKGLLKLNIIGSSARTIYPDDKGSITAISAFAKFDLIVTQGVTEQPALTKRNAALTDITGAGNAMQLTVDLPYVIRVNAYLDNADTLPQAIGSTTITLTTVGGSQTTTISVKEITDGNEDGTFAWFFTAAELTNYDTADLTVSSTSIVVDLKNTGDEEGDEDIPSGYYDVSLSLTGAGVQAVTLTTKLHIYQGMTTTVNSTLLKLPTLRPNIYAVTYDYGDDTSNTGASSENLLHGSYITNDPDVTVDNTDLEFVGWYTESGFTNLFASAADVAASIEGTTPAGKRIVGATDLYAKWYDTTSGTTPDLTITNVTVDWSAETDPKLLGYVADYTRGDSLIIKIVVENWGDYSNVEYQLDTDLSPQTVNEDPAPGNSGKGLIELDFSADVNIGLWQLGTHTLTVFGDDYSTTIEFEIQ